MGEPSSQEGFVKQLGGPIWAATNCSGRNASIAMMTHADPSMPMSRIAQVQNNRLEYARAHADVASCVSTWMPATRPAIYARFPIIWALMHGDLFEQPTYTRVLCVDFDILIMRTVPFVNALAAIGADVVVASSPACQPRMESTDIAVTSVFQNNTFSTFYNNGAFLMRKSEVARRLLTATFYSRQPDPIAMNAATRLLPPRLLQRVAIVPVIDTNWMFYHAGAWMLHFNGLSSPVKYRAMDGAAVALGRAAAKSGMAQHRVKMRMLRIMQDAWNEQILLARNAPNQHNSKVCVLMMTHAGHAACRWCLSSSTSEQLPCMSFQFGGSATLRESRALVDKAFTEKLIDAKSELLHRSAGLVDDADGLGS